MEIFHFIEHSFDINLINKCKTHLGSKSIKKINLYLRDLSEIDLNSNNLKVTVNNVNNNKNINYSFEESINNNQMLNSHEKENTASEVGNIEAYLSD